MIATSNTQQRNTRPTTMTDTLTDNYSSIRSSSGSIRYNLRSHNIIEFSIYNNYIVVSVCNLVYLF